MKFKRPTVETLRSSGTERFAHSNGRPEWLTEWIANQGRWAELTCGHKEDLNDKALLIIAVFGKHGKGTDVFCERCNAFVGVKAKWKNPPKDIPNEPMF